MIKYVRRECNQCVRQCLVGKIIDIQQYNCDIWVGEQIDYIWVNYQYSIQCYDYFMGNDQVYIKLTLEQRWQVIIEDIIEVSKQYWYLGEYCDFFQVKVVNFKYEQWDLCVKSILGWFCQEMWQCDILELMVMQDLINGYFFCCVYLVLGFLIINNIVVFFIGQMFLVVWMFIENQLCYCLDKV